MSVHRSPDRLLDSSLTDALIELGGYVHPLFTDPVFLQASPFASRPVPGQALLLLMGGLAEQSGAYGDEFLALLGFERVTFRAPACDGDTVFVEIELLGDEPGSDGRVTRWNWACHRQDGVLLAEAIPRFLIRRSR